MHKFTDAFRLLGSPLEWFGDTLAIAALALMLYLGLWAAHLAEPCDPQFEACKQEGSQ